MDTNSINKELEKAVIYEKDLKKLKSLLAAGADINFRESSNRDTLLHRTNSAEVAKELLLYGADVNALNTYGETPLDYVTSYGKGLLLAKVLLTHGAWVNVKNRKKNTPLHHAARRSDSSLEVVYELLKFGADIDMWNRHNDTPLDYAINYNTSCDKAKLLIRFALINRFSESYKNIVNLDPYKENSKYSELLSYLNDCVLEIRQMKTQQINAGLSLYEIVQKNFNKQILCNNQISVRLSKIEFDVHYPIYNDIIVDMIKPSLDRVDLLNKLSKIPFYIYVDKSNEDVKGDTNTIVLDYYSTYNISEYLSNEHLSNFIAAVEGPKDIEKTIVQPDASVKRINEDFPNNDDSKRAKID